MAGEDQELLYYANLEGRRCHWCGDTKAGFYHRKCAEIMSKGNREEVSKVLASYQQRCDELTKALENVQACAVKVLKPTR